MGTDQAKFAKNLIYGAIHDTHFEPTFSTSNTFQVQILTGIYDKTRVYQMLKAEFRLFLVDFVPFSGLNFSYWSGSRCRKLRGQPGPNALAAGFKVEP